VNTLPVTLLRPGGRGVAVSLREAWQGRELLFFLVWRDVKVRYKQTVLGIAWAVIQPLLGMVVFTLFFGRLADMPSDGVPYPLFSFAALVPWTYFASAVSNGAMSVAQSRYLIAKVFFPRLFIPLAAIAMPAVDLLIALGMLLVLLAAYGQVPPPTVVLLPVLVLLLPMLAFAVTLWTSALTVQYRDMRYLIPFGVQLLLFLTPVAYPASLVPERWRAVYYLNPMAAIVDAFRAVLLGTPGPGGYAAISAVVAVIVCVTGLLYFRSVESTLVDLL
jgi:lipopolysaccharide transport system permease protein